MAGKARGPMLGAAGGVGDALRGRDNDYTTLTAAYELAEGRVWGEPVAAGTMAQPLSVVIPAFEAGATLGHVLDALARVEDVKLDVVVVDDASHDLTARIAARHWSTPTVLRLPRRVGPGDARNVGVALAAAETVLFMDADVVVSGAAVAEHAVRAADGVVCLGLHEDLSVSVTVDPPKTKNGRRETTLPRRIARELDAHLAAYADPEPDALVFTNTHGQPLRRAGFRRSWWMPAVAAAGLSPLTFHELRHTFVSLWVALNVNPKEISVRAGHSSVAFTLDRYGHLYERPDDALADRLDDLLGDITMPKPARVLELERPPAARSPRGSGSERARKAL